MADKNRGQLRTAIRSVLKEPTAARWSDTDINDYINNALEEVSRALMRMKTVTSSVLKDAETVSLPSDCLVLHELYWIDSNDDKTEIERQFEDQVPMTDTADDTGTPTKFWLINDTVYLRPVPDANGTVEFLYYWEMPDLDSDDDTPALSGLNNVIKAHAVYEAYFDDGDPRYEIWEDRRNKELLSWLSIEASICSTGFKQEENF